MDPEILVIDEPTSQLDPEGTEGVFEIIHMLKEQGKTIILVEHKVDLMAEYADEMLVMHEGELIAKGETHAVLSDLSMLKKGAMLPQTVLLTRELERQGIIFPHIPVTKKECIEW